MSEGAEVDFSGDDLGRIQGELLEAARPQGIFALGWQATTGDVTIVYLRDEETLVRVRQGCYDSKTGRRLATSAMVALVWMKMHAEFKRKGWLR